MINAVNPVQAGYGQVPYLPGASLRAPGNLFDKFTHQQPMLPGPTARPMGPIAGSDSLQTSAAKPPVGSGLRLSAIGDNLRMFALEAPTPVQAKGAESLSVAGLPVMIHWEQRSAQRQPRIPAGYHQIKGALPKGLSQVATKILNQGNPIGTYTPFSLDGKQYLALNEYHTHYASRPNDPPGHIYAITVFAKD